VFGADGRLIDETVRDQARQFIAAFVEFAKRGSAGFADVSARLHSP